MDTNEPQEPEETGAQMSFLEHLDELRRRLVNSVVIIVIAFVFCWFVSGYIFDFLSVPIRRALTEAEQREVPITGLAGSEQISPLSSLKVGDGGRYVFERVTRLGATTVQPGASVQAVVATDAEGNLGLFTDEPLITTDSVVPKGVRLPADLNPNAPTTRDPFERMIVTTAVEPFTLYVTVSLYSAIALAVPLLLLQVWALSRPHCIDTNAPM